MSHQIKIAEYSKYFAVDTPSTQTEEYKCIRALRQSLEEKITKELDDRRSRCRHIGSGVGLYSWDGLRLDTWIRQHRSKANVTPVIEKIANDGIAPSLDDCLAFTKYRSAMSLQHTTWNLFQLQEGAASAEYFRTKFGLDFTSYVHLQTNPNEHYLRVGRNEYLEVLDTSFVICTDKFVNPQWALLVDELGFWKLWHNKQCHTGRFVNELKPLVEKLITQNHEKEMKQ